MKLNIIRKALTYDWIDVHKKDGSTYKRRQRKKVKEQENVRSFDERKKEYESSTHLAGLKDALVHSLKYNGNYYEPKSGKRIFVPDEYKDVVEERSHAKQSGASFVKDYLDRAGVENKEDFEKKKQQNSIGKIMVMDKHYNNYHAKVKGEFEKLASNPEHYKQVVRAHLEPVNKQNSSIAKMLGGLKAVRAAVGEHIDPTIEISYKGKKQEKTLNEILERLENQHKENKNPYENTGIEKLDLKNLDDYEIGDFAKKEFKLNQSTHDRIYAQIEKDLAKQQKKAAAGKK